MNLRIFTPPPCIKAHIALIFLLGIQFNNSKDRELSATTEAASFPPLFITIRNRNFIDFHKLVNISLTLVPRPVPTLKE